MFIKTIHNDALCHWNTQNGSVEKDGNLTVFLLFNWLQKHIDENDFQNIYLLQLRNLRHPKLLILPQVRLKKQLARCVCLKMFVMMWNYIKAIIYMHGNIKLLRFNMIFLSISTQKYYSTLWYTLVYIHLHYMAV